MTCPLPESDTADLDQGVLALLPKCQRERCPFSLGPDYDSDYMPGGCVLLVVAMCDPARARAKP